MKLRIKHMTYEQICEIVAIGELGHKDAIIAFGAECVEIYKTRLIKRMVATGVITGSICMIMGHVKDQMTKRKKETETE